MLYAKATFRTTDILGWNYLPYKFSDSKGTHREDIPVVRENWHPGRLGSYLLISELNNIPPLPGLQVHLKQWDRQGCVVQALVIFIKNNFGSKNSTLDSVILSIKKTIIQEQIQKILNYENKSIKAPFIYIMYTQTGQDSQSRRIESTVIA